MEMKENNDKKTKKFTSFIMKIIIKMGLWVGIILLQNGQEDEYLDLE